MSCSYATTTTTAEVISLLPERAQSCRPSDCANPYDDDIFECYRVFDRVRCHARLLDSEFQIGSLVFGIDALLGLIPVLGDVIGLALSIHLIYAPLATIPLPHEYTQPLKEYMWKCLAVDFITGLIPVVGDTFDLIWTSNLMIVTRAQNTILDFERMVATKRCNQPLTSSGQIHVLPDPHIQNTATSFRTSNIVAPPVGYGTFGTMEGGSPHVSQVDPSSPSPHSTLSNPLIGKTPSGPKNTPVARRMFAHVRPQASEQRWQTFFEQKDLAAQSGMGSLPCPSTLQAPNVFSYNNLPITTNAAIANQAELNDGDPNNYSTHDNHHQTDCSSNVDTMVQSPEALPPPSSLPPPPPWQHPGHHRRPSFWQQAAMQDALKRQYIEAGLPSPVIPIPKASSNSTNTAGLSSFKAAMCHRLQVEPTPRAFVEIDNEALVQYQHELHCLQVRQLEALQRYQLQQLEHLQQQQLQLRLQQDHLRALVRQEEDRALDRGEPRLDLEPAVEPLGAKCEHFGQGTADAAVSKDAERGGHAYNGNRPVQSSVTMAPKVDLDATEDPWMLVEAAKAKRARLKKATKLNTKRKRTSTPGCEELERELRRPRLGSLPAPFSISIKDWVLDKADRSNRATGQYHHHFHLFYPQPAKSGHGCFQDTSIANLEPFLSIPPLALDLTTTNPIEVGELAMDELSSIAALPLKDGQPSPLEALSSSVNMHLADSGINNMAFAADDGSSLEPPEGSMAESMDDSGIDTSTTSSEDEVDEGEHYEPVGAMTLAEAQQSGAGLIWPHDWSGVLQQKEEKEEEEEEEEDEEHEEHEVEQPLSRSLQSTFRALERSEIEAQQCSSSDTGNDADGEGGNGPPNYNDCFEEVQDGATHVQAHSQTAISPCSLLSKFPTPPPPPPQPCSPLRASLSSWADKCTVEWLQSSESGED